MRILCVTLALACVILLIWVWSQRRALHRAAQQLREVERTDSAARLRLAAPNRAAEELLDAVNVLLELRQADRASFRERERSLRRQIANVSHDLRTPLTSILGYLQLLEDEALPAAERREYLTVVASRAKALQSLITSFYDLSRLESGEYPLRREKVDLYTSLSGLLAAFYNDFTDAGFDVTVDLAQGLPSVTADPSGVLRVFTNLLRNALDRDRWRCVCFGRGMRWSACSATVPAALRRRISPMCSTASSPRTKCAPAATPAWDWPSSRRWLTRWAAVWRPDWTGRSFSCASDGSCEPAPPVGSVRQWRKEKRSRLPYLCIWSTFRRNR